MCFFSKGIWVFVSLRKVCAFYSIFLSILLVKILLNSNEVLTTICYN